ncbi:phospholipase-like protein [Artemisia annua]|uniref:Phospholipase-like protein n=1 Tax=Artemisia annua TaxID=35608 RepID=A0A2U1N253_ARTAN|nr:phospholipase-like protein [Artemisia annua]
MSYATRHISNNPSLKSYVERMGFGKILKLRIEIIPSNLAWSILSCYEVGNRCLVLNGQRVEITKGLVYEVLGFPSGSLEIEFAKRTNDKNLKYLGLMETFWKQFGMKDVVGEKDNPKMKRSYSTKLKDFILKRKTIDDTFKLNFIILLVTTMICASKGGESNMKFLPTIKEHYDNLHMYDWCGLVLKSLDQNPPELANNSAKNQYCGPLTFLTLVYIRWLFQRTKRNEAVIEYCSTDLLKKVDDEHKKLKNFGEFFDNDELFFCEKNIRVVDEPVVDESNDVLLIENKHVREEESQDVDFESQENESKQNQSLESSKSKEVTNPLSEEFFSFEENDVTVAEVGQAPPPGDIVSVQGYSVKPSIAPILEAIFNKHGNIAADCFLREASVRTYFLEVICEVARLIETNDVATIISKMEEIEFQMSEVEAANIDVSWLQAQLETTLLMEMKVNIILAKRAARTDLIERCEELVAAKERCVKAEEYIKVLDVVEDKPINTVIAKRAARVDLRERCREHAVAKDQFDKAERCVKVLDLVEEKLNNNILESKAENRHG